MNALTKEEALTMAREAGLRAARMLDALDGNEHALTAAEQQEINAAVALVAAAYARGVEDAAVTASRVSVAAAAAIRNRSKT